MHTHAIAALRHCAGPWNSSGSGSGGSVLLGPARFEERAWKALSAEFNLAVAARSDPFEIAMYALVGLFKIDPATQVRCVR